MSVSIFSYEVLSNRTRLESFSLTFPLLHFCEAKQVAKQCSVRDSTAGELVLNSSS